MSLDEFFLNIMVKWMNFELFVEVVLTNMIEGCCGFRKNIFKYYFEKNY